MNQTVLTTPVQPRAKRTYESLLKAAQEILLEDGYDALNSNAVAERAGLTPPSFYRYFSDKHMLLKVLAQRLLDAQDELAEIELLPVTPTFEGAVDAIERLLSADIELTRSFAAARELLVLMRALPELREVRLATHERSARLLAEATREFYPHLSHAVLETRVRLASELYFSTLEMLFDTEFRNKSEIVRRAAIAIQAAISMPDE